MEFRLLGPVEILVGAQPVPIRRRQERLALAVLLLQAGQPVSADRLAELIWAQEPPSSARDVVQTYLSRLRRVLRAADAGAHGVRLERRGHAYLLEVDPETVDVHRFQRLLDQARTVTAPGPRAELLRSALALWRGPALADVGEDDVRERLAARLEESRRRALDQRIVADLANGRHEDLLGELTELVAAAPLDERLTGHLMLALYRAGRRNDAIARYRAVHERTRDELGLDPGDELRALNTSILRRDPALDLTPAPASRPDAPAVPPAAPALAAPPDATRSGVRFGVLGPLLVYDESGTAHPLAVAQHRRLLAILLLRANRVVSFQELADSLWDGNPPAGFRPTLRNYVRLVRQAVGPELAARLVTRPPGYLIELGDDELDMSRFTRLCLEGGDSVREQAWDRAHDQLAAALALWRGPAFSDVPSDLIQDIEVPHLTGLRLQAWEWRIEADLQLGRHDELVDELRRLVGEHRLRERFWEQLMLALYRSGRQADALAAYTRVRKILAEELGVEPGPALQEAQRRILSADAALIDGPAPAGGSARGRTAAPAPAQLPLDVRGFAGRDRELAALDAIATGAETEPTAVAITAVSGTAGVGKTALAVHWARRVADRFPDGQLYLNLRGFDREGTVMSEAEAVRALLDSLELPAERIPVGFDAQTALLRSLLTGRRMLILLDNARDADQVRPLLPGAPGCLVLVTSRNQLAGLIVADDAHSVTLDVLSEAESIDVLAHRLGRGRVDAERAAATEIVAACARLPLALGVVAARAAMHPGFPLSVLADELRQTRGGLDAFAGGDTASDVRAVLSWSYRTLSPAAASLFRLIALHTGPDITAPAAASLAARPPGTVRPLLAELARAHLVAEHAPGRYASHDLLRAYATELVQVHDAPAEREAAVHRVLAHYLHTALTADALLVPHWDLVDPPMLPAGVTPEPIADPGRALDWFSGEHAVLLAAAGQAAAVGRDEYTAHLAGALMNFLDRRGYWEDLAATQRLALAAADRLGDLALNAHVRRSLARAYARTGRYDEALGHLRPALAISIELGDARSQARTHLSLAWVQELRGDYAVALEHARRVLDLGRVMNHQPTEASALNTIGWLYSRLDDDQRAVAVCQRSLRIFEELADIFGQAFTLDSLGFAYHRMGRFDEAVDAYSRSADLLRELGDRYNEAIARRNLGDAYAEAGQATAARAAWRRSVDLLDEMSHPDAEPVRARLSTGAVPAQAGAQ